MYDQVGEDAVFLMLYAAVAMMSLMSCCYLLLRRSNAIAPDVTPPIRLRRWTAAFLAAMTLSHLWYLPMIFLTSSKDILLSIVVGAVLDCMTLIPFAIALLLVMLQDRRRPLWPVFAMMVPIIIGLVGCGVNSSVDLLPVIYAYYLLLGIGIVIYMVRALRQYGRWLRDNYADLEHKELWQSFMLLGIMLLVFAIYSFSVKTMVYKYIAQVNDIILICYLLWRVETLSDLSLPVNDAEEEFSTTEKAEDSDLSLFIRNNIGPLLKQHCEEPQLYLQYDISVAQLAKQIGTNRVYLSKYFALQDTTYNAYINDLRIQHFIRLYHESVATGQLVIAKQLAHQSGFRSYSTFSSAFKQIMGTTATEWMRNLEAE